MNSLQFKQNEFKKFCSLVCFKPEVVLEISNNIDNYYREWIEEKIDNKTGLPKIYLDGTTKKRTIRPSQKELKTIQSLIKNKILAPISLPPQVHGGIKHHSNITNAKPHQGNKYIFTTDLQDFFPNISSEKVYQTLLLLNFSPHFSHWITRFTTWKGELPQGTPTSTHIANLVFLKTDIELIKLCRNNGITYSRFIDDLTFSSQQNFKELLPSILSIIQKNNFKLSHRKTKYKGKQTVTGIEVFLNKIDAPIKIIEKSKLEIENKKDIKPYTNYRNNILKTNRKNKP